jgi:carboxyvinyl-carboxyphosphonate phosphorylmutase
MMASVFDPLSARMAQDLGFGAGLMGGSLVSAVVLGAPDILLLTLTELADHVARTARACAVPILVDADHGYGNALNVMRTVQELDRAGAAAVKIEDTALPRPFGSPGGQQLLSIAEAEGKIRAALRAREGSDLVVIGRTNAVGIAGLDEGIARLRLMESWGIDALFLPSLESRRDLDAIAQAVHLPIILGTAGGELVDPAYLASRRVRLWSGGHQGFSIAVNALYQAMRQLREGRRNDELQGVAPKALLDKLLRSADHEADARDFLQVR